MICAAWVSAADIDGCVLDWQREGLTETLATLRRARIAIAGAGAELEAAQALVVVSLATVRGFPAFNPVVASRQGCQSLRRAASARRSPWRTGPG